MNGWGFTTGADEAEASDRTRSGKNKRLSDYVNTRRAGSPNGPGANGDAMAWSTIAHGIHTRKE